MTTADDGGTEIDEGSRSPAAAEKAKAPDAAQIRTWALKWVFVLVALGLVVSTLLGLWMAFTTGRRKGVILMLVLVGAAACRFCSWRL